MKIWRQGDLYISEVETIPTDAIPRKTLVLAKGEATGHAHRLEDGANLSVYEITADDPSRPGSVFYVKVKKRSTRLLHEEHHEIVLDPGLYRIWRQREYHPAEIKTVID